MKREEWERYERLERLAQWEVTLRWAIVGWMGLGFLALLILALP